MSVSVPRRYARALLDAVEDAARFDRVLAQLEDFIGIFQSNPELAAAMEQPGYARSERASVVEALLKSAGAVDPLVSNLFRLLVERDRLMYLSDIGRVFRDLGDTREGRLRGRLATAAPLPRESVRRLESSLTQLTQRKVLLESRVDPSLLGGAAAQVGSTLYDGSLRSQLQELRTGLKRPSE